MLRSLKKLIGIWEPREGVIYRFKHIGPPTAYIRGKNTVILPEYSVNGKEWTPCTFKLENGVYEVHVKQYFFGNTIRVFWIEKKYVKTKKMKKWYEIYSQPDAGEVTEIHYRLLIKDPSKIIENSKDKQKNR